MTPRIRFRVLLVSETFDPVPAARVSVPDFVGTAGADRKSDTPEFCQDDLERLIGQVAAQNLTRIWYQRVPLVIDPQMLLTIQTDQVGVNPL